MGVPSFAIPGCCQLHRTAYRGVLERQSLHLSSLSKASLRPLTSRVYPLLPCSASTTATPAAPLHPRPPPSPLSKTNSGSKHATTAARYPPILPQSHRRRSSRLPPSERARRLHRVMPLLQQEKHPATSHILEARRRTRRHNLGP